MSSLWKHIQRVNKRATKFRVIILVQDLTIEGTSKWQPNKLSVVMTRRNRRFATPFRTWEPKNLRNPYRGVSIFATEDGIEMTITLYRRSKDVEFEDKMYSVIIEENSLPMKRGKHRQIALTKVNLSKFVDVDAPKSYEKSPPSTFNVSNLVLQPLTKKVVDANITFSVTSQFIKEGMATDDDMISIASLLSIKSDPLDYDGDDVVVADVGNLRDFESLQATPLPLRKENKSEQINDNQRTSIMDEISQLTSQLEQLAQMKFGDDDDDTLPKIPAIIHQDDGELSLKVTNAHDEVEEPPLTSNENDKVTEFAEIANHLLSESKTEIDQAEDDVGKQTTIKIVSDNKETSNTSPPRVKPLPTVKAKIVFPTFRKLTSPIVENKSFSSDIHSNGEDKGPVDNVEHPTSVNYENATSCISKRMVDESQMENSTVNHKEPIEPLRTTRSAENIQSLKENKEASDSLIEEVHETSDVPVILETNGPSNDTKSHDSPSPINENYSDQSPEPPCTNGVTNHNIVELSLPLSSPPPAPSNIPLSPTSPTADIKQELEEVEKELLEIDTESSSLEPKIRSVMQQEGPRNKNREEAYLKRWIYLVNRKNALIRRQMQLNLLEKEKDLEQRSAILNEEYRQLMAVEDWQKTPLQREREAQLLQELVQIVEQRNELVQSQLTQEEALEDDEMLENQLKLADITFDGTRVSFFVFVFGLWIVRLTRTMEVTASAHMSTGAPN